MTFPYEVYCLHKVIDTVFEDGLFQLNETNLLMFIFIYKHYNNDQWLLASQFIEDINTFKAISLTKWSHILIKVFRILETYNVSLYYA